MANAVKPVILECSVEEGPVDKFMACDNLTIHTSITSYFKKRCVLVIYLLLYGIVFLSLLFQLIVIMTTPNAMTPRMNKNLNSTPVFVFSLRMKYSFTFFYIAALRIGFYSVHTSIFNKFNLNDSRQLLLNIRSSSFFCFVIENWFHVYFM